MAKPKVPAGLGASGRSLKLPDAPDTERTSTYVSEQARAAARARWGTRKGT